MRTIPLYTVLAFMALAAAEYGASMRTDHERDPLVVSSITGIPVQLLDDDAGIAAFERTGYLRSFKAMRPQFELVIASHEDGDQPCRAYCTAESSRFARMLERAFGVTYYSRLIDEISADPERLSEYARSMRRISECRRKLRGDPSTNDIETALERSIAELELAGCERWTDRAFETLADFHFARGEDAEGARCLEEALQRVIETGHPPSESNLAGRIGAHYVRKGNLESAEKFYGLSLSSAERSGDPYYIGRSLSFLGCLRCTEGYFVEAESLLVRSCRCSESACDPNATISRNIILARLLNVYGDADRAAGIAERSILLAEETLSDTSASGPLYAGTMTRQYLASGLALLSRIHRENGRLDEAIACMNRALSIARGGNDLHYRSELEKQLGDIYAAAGRGGEAMQCYERALAVSRKLKEYRRIAEYQTAVARLLLKERRYGEAEDLLEKAIRTSIEERYWMQQIESRHLLGRTKAAIGDRGAGRRLFAGAIELFEEESKDKPYVEDRHALHGLIDTIYADLIALESDDPRRVDSLLFWIEKSRQRDPVRAEALCGSEIDEGIRTCIARLDWLPRKTAVVQYTLLPGRLIITVTDRHGSKSRVRAADKEALEADVFAFIDRCTASPSPVPAGSPFERAPQPGTAEIASRLSAALLEPISDFIDSLRTICFIPDGVLRFIPFAALTDPAADRFLIESKTVLTSPTLLDLYRGSTGGEGGSAGGPYRAPLLIGSPDLPPLFCRIYPHLDTLRHAESELCRIGELLAECTVLKGAEATKQAVLSRIPSADLVHIASHTVNYPRHGERTAILCSCDAEITGERELAAALLTEAEISELNLAGIRLVVLSACESVWGVPSAGRGGTGLAASFIRAGAGAVVASVWPVGDRDMERIVTAFYERLSRGGENPLEALCSVQRSIIADGRMNHNQFENIQIWAPLAFIGPLPN